MERFKWSRAMDDEFRKENGLPDKQRHHPPWVKAASAVITALLVGLVLLFLLIVAVILVKAFWFALTL